MRLKHVLFDSKPEVICHVCPEHKSIADSLPCDDDKGADGECAHVQYRPCDCADPEPCVACPLEGAVSVEVAV
jgi:hypothetical protein